MHACTRAPNRAGVPIRVHPAFPYIIIAYKYTSLASCFVFSLISWGNSLCKLFIHAFPSGIASAQRVLGRGRFPNLFVLIYCRSTLLIAPAIVQLAWLEIVGQKLLISHGFTLTSSVLNNLFFMGASVATILGNVLNWNVINASSINPLFFFVIVLVSLTRLFSCNGKSGTKWIILGGTW